MPRLLLWLFAASCLLAQYKPNPDCKIEGQVTSATTGAPLKNATVRISSTGDVTSWHGVRRFVTISDAQGRFIFDSLLTATYTVNVERTGYLSLYDAALAEYSIAHPVTKDLAIKLAPQGIISGRVLDEDGDPVPAAQIELLRRHYQDGVRRLLPMTTGQVQADGAFAIGDIDPGWYYVRAVPRNLSSELRPNQLLAPEYFPSGANVATAHPVKIGVGTHLEEINFRLPRVRAFRVSGSIDPRSTPLKNLALTMTRDDGTTGNFTGVADGRFEFSGLTPGTYLIDAMNTSGKNAAQVERIIKVTVRDQDVDNVVVEVHPRVERPPTTIYRITPPATAHVAIHTQDRDDRALARAILQACTTRGECLSSWRHSIDLPPDEYLIFVWEDHADGFIDDPEFRRLFESQAVKVKLDENARVNLEVKLIIKEAMDTEIIKLP
jgi:hypothetical protein